MIPTPKKRRGRRGRPIHKFVFNDKLHSLQIEYAYFKWFGVVAATTRQGHTKNAYTRPEKTKINLKNIAF